MQEAQSTSRETVRVLAALSDENRFRIVERLATEGGELTCGAIGKALGISPSLLSHHLAILADAGVVARRKNGLWTMNALDRPVISRQIAVLEALVHGAVRGDSAEPVNGSDEPAEVEAPTDADERVAAGGS